MQKILISSAVNGLRLIPADVEKYCKLKFDKQIYLYVDIVVGSKKDYVIVFKQTTVQEYDIWEAGFCADYNWVSGITNKDDFYKKHQTTIFEPRKIPRDDEILLKVFKENKEAYPKSYIVEIPDGVDWYIHESEDGSETIYENHRVWRVYHSKEWQEEHE